MATTTITSASKSHTLTVKYVKGRTSWEGDCSCERFSISGAPSEKTVCDQFEIHAARNTTAADRAAAAEDGALTSA